MDLKTLPRYSLAQFPTPVHLLENLTDKYKGPDIYIKRDDATLLGMGGNKTRKLEFLIAQALKANKDTLVTAGGIQSNHCRLTAAASRKAGLDCHLVLNGKEPENPNGNLLLDRILMPPLNIVTEKRGIKPCLRQQKKLLPRGKNHM